MRRTAIAPSPTADATRLIDPDRASPAAQRRRRLLVVLLRELAADSALPASLGRALPRARLRRRRCAGARVRVRARPRERASRFGGAGRRLPGRDRQRLLDLAVGRHPLLAGP